MQTLSLKSCQKLLNLAASMLCQEGSEDVAGQVHLCDFHVYSNLLMPVLVIHGRFVKGIPKCHPGYSMLLFVTGTRLVQRRFFKAFVEC